MNMLIVGIRDEVAGYFLPLQYCRSEGEARRQFTDVVNHASQENAIFAHPGDFGLYLLGEYNTETGVIKPIGLVSLLVNGLAVKVDADAERVRKVN